MGVPTTVVRTAETLSSLNRNLLIEVGAGRAVGFDVETYGPSVRHKRDTKPVAHLQQLAGYSFALQDGRRWYVPVGHRGFNFRQWKSPLSLLQNPQARVVAHNWKFELQVMMNVGIRTSCVMLDSQICAWMCGWRLDGKKGLKLKALVREHFAESPATFEEVANGRGMNELTADEAADYCGDDAYNCLRLWDKAWAFMGANGLQEPYLNIEMPVIPIVRHMEQAGLPINRTRLQQAREQCITEAQRLKGEFETLTTTELLLPTKKRVQRACDECAGEGCGGCNMSGLLWFKNGKPRMHTVLVDMPQTAGADVGSSQQVVRWLFDELKWWPREGHPTTDGGQPSTKMDDLLQFLTLPGKPGEAARLRIRYQALMKYVSTYTTNLIAIADQYPDKCLHTSYHQTGTDTQRFSSTFPNISNMPRSGDGGKSYREGLPDIREALVCLPGWKYVIRDYSQIELKLVAHISKDPVMLRIYAEDGDIHQQTMDAIGAERPDAKIVNFSVIYRISKKRLAIKLESDEATAAEYIKGFHQKYRRIKPYYTKAIEHLDRTGHVPTLTGFKRFLDPWAISKKGKSLRHLQENRAINGPIQGSAGGILKLALIRLYRRWEAKGWLGTKAFIVGQTYDEIITRVREELVEEADADIKWAMEGAYKLRVPLTTEGGSGNTWSEAK